MSMQDNQAQLLTHAFSKSDLLSNYFTLTTLFMIAWPGQLISQNQKALTRKTSLATLLPKHLAAPFEEAQAYSALNCKTVRFNKLTNTLALFHSD